VQRRVGQADLDGIPVGVQPEADGRLLCRYCGRWYRSPGHHLRPGHGIDPDSYREQFQLPTTRALMAADLREKNSERAKELLATNETLRAAFALDDPDNAERRKRQARGVRRKAETEPRAGVQLSKQAVGAMLAEHSRDLATQRRRDNNAAARGRGYRNLAELLEQTVHPTDAGLGDFLGWGAAKARWWRRHYGVRGQARTIPARDSDQRLRAGLDLIPRGIQPQRSGSLRCRVRGRWWQDLSQHLTGTHKMTTTQYRTTYGLPPDQPLQGDARRRGNARLAE
jgi:predicted transcriptional regulator